LGKHYMLKIKNLVIIFLMYFFLSLC